MGKYGLSSSFSSDGLSESFGSSLKYVSSRLGKLKITLRELTIALVWDLYSIGNSKGSISLVSLFISSGVFGSCCHWILYAWFTAVWICLYFLIGFVRMKF